MKRLTAVIATICVLALATATFAQNDNSISTNAARMSTESGGVVLLVGVCVVMLIAGVGIGFAIGKKR